MPGPIRLVLAFGLLTAVAPEPADSQAVGASPAPCPSDQSEPIFSEVGSSDEEVDAFLAALKRAVADDDRRTVAAMIRYPIAAWTRDKDVTYKAADALVAAYDSVFTPRLRKLIADARRECLFTNSRGAMIHDGEIWFAAVPRGGLKIIKVNGPVGTDR